MAPRVAAAALALVLLGTGGAPAGAQEAVVEADAIVEPGVSIKFEREPAFDFGRLEPQATSFAIATAHIDSSHKCPRAALLVDGRRGSPPGYLTNRGHALEQPLHALDADGKQLPLSDQPVVLRTWESATFEQVLELVVSQFAGRELEDGTYSTRLTFQLDLGDCDTVPPDTTITSGPSGATSDPSPTFTFTSDEPGSTFVCEIGEQPTPCASPFNVGPLEDGEHAFSVWAVDERGNADPTPAVRSFVVATATPTPTPSPDPSPTPTATATAEPTPTVVPVMPTPPSPPDRDADGIGDAADNCPDTANSDQRDADADGLGDACDALPPGNLPPQAGVRAAVRVLSGEVYVRLPTHALLGFDGMRAPLQLSGFQPFKGAATVPLGSTVDARRGQVSVEAAANGFGPFAKGLRTQRARVFAGMFKLRQQRKRAKARASERIPVDFRLTHAGDAARGCTGPRPAKGIVRSVTIDTGRGMFRALGGASKGLARNALFSTTDRCDGTLTTVGRGAVTLTVKGRKKPVRVRAGRSYLAKARLFAARKGRTPATRRGL